MKDVEGARYLWGAPDDWSTWLRAGDAVAITMVTSNPDVELPASETPVSLANDLVITTDHGQGRLALNRIARIDIGGGTPPVTSADLAPAGTPDHNRMPFGLIHLNSLTVLPRRAYDWLGVTLRDRTMTFEVTERHWADEQLVTPDALASLTLEDDTRILSIKHQYRWVDIARFAVPPGRRHETPIELVATLLDHPDYWFGYISERLITPGIHGPYRLDAISVGSFDEVDPETASAMVTDWVHHLGPVPDGNLRGDIEVAHRAIRAADVRFHLRDLGEAAFHEVGWILSQPFLELVLMGPNDTLSVLVASGD